MLLEKIANYYELNEIASYLCCETDEEVYELLTSLREAGEHGCSSGCFPRLVYTYDCVNFFNENKELIEEYDLSEEILDRFSKIEILMDPNTAKTIFVWGFVESVANAYEEEISEMIEEYEEEEEE